MHSNSMVSDGGDTCCYDRAGDVDTDDVARTVRVCVAGRPSDVAELIARRIRHTTVFTDYGARGVWVVFEPRYHRWTLRRDPLGDAVQDRLFFLPLLNTVTDVIASPPPCIRRNPGDRMVQMERMLRKLCERPFRAAVVNQLRERCFKPAYVDGLDHASDILCFHDGVYDVRTATRRQGRPDDMACYVANARLGRVTTADRAILTHILSRSRSEHARLLRARSPEVALVE